MTRSTTRMQQISTSIYRKYKLSVLYASLTIPVGIILIFFDKAPSRNDFLDHWNRAEQIAAGQFTAIPDPSGTGNYGAINKDGVFEAFNNTAINSPFTYFPSVFGGGHLRISCLLTLLFSTLFVCIAISLAKQDDTIIFGIAILPIFFLSSIYPTADAITNSISLLWVAFILYLYQQEKLSWHNILATCLLALFLGQIKMTCIILILLIALPMIRQYQLNHKIDYRFVIPVIISLSSAICWMQATKNVPPSAVSTVEQYKEAKLTVLHHPGEILKSLGISLINPLDLTNDKHDTGRNIQFFTGAEYTQLPFAVMMPILFAVVLLVLYRNKNLPEFHIAEITATAAIIILFYTLTCTGLIVSWGGVALGSYASGLQSRYFIPIYALVCLLIPNLGILVIDRKKIRIFISALIGWSYSGLLLAHLFVFPWQL